MTTNQTLPSGGPPVTMADGSPLPTEPPPPPPPQEDLIQVPPDLDLPAYRAPTVGDDGIPSFDDEEGDEDRQPRPFKLGGQTFYAAHELPVRQLLRFMSLNEEWRTAQLSDADKLLEELFRQCLIPESMERFSAGLGDLEHPIPMTKIPRVIEWLLTEYSGGRPTPASSPSSPDSESPGTGRSSTDASPPAGLTLATSEPTASST